MWHEQAVHSIALIRAVGQVGTYIVLPFSMGMDMHGKGSWRRAQTSVGFFPMLKLPLQTYKNILARREEVMHTQQHWGMSFRQTHALSYVELGYPKPRPFPIITATYVTGFQTVVEVRPGPGYQVFYDNSNK